MFHANAWGIPYAAWMAGSDMLMPGGYLQAEPLCCMIGEFRPTMAAGVPTILSAMFHYAEARSIDLSFFRILFSGERRCRAAWRRDFWPNTMCGWCRVGD